MVLDCFLGLFFAPGSVGGVVGMGGGLLLGSLLSTTLTSQRYMQQNCGALSLVLYPQAACEFRLLQA